MRENAHYGACAHRNDSFGKSIFVLCTGFIFSMQDSPLLTRQCKPEKRSTHTHAHTSLSSGHGSMAQDQPGFDELTHDRFIIFCNMFPKRVHSQHIMAKLSSGPPRQFCELYYSPVVATANYHKCCDLKQKNALPLSHGGH